MIRTKNINRDNQKEALKIPQNVIATLLNFEHSSILISLYILYCYLSQKNNLTQFDMSNEIISKLLKTGIEKIKKCKTTLIQIGLLKSMQIKDEHNRIIRHEIQLVQHFDIKLFQRNDFPLGGNFTPWLSSIYINNSKELFTLKEKEKEKEKIYITQEMFEEFWRIYPKKVDKGKCLTKWNTICSRPNSKKPKWREIKRAIMAQIKTERWKQGYIPHPTTWLNQNRWLDDPNEMKSYKPISNNSSGSKAYSNNYNERKYGNKTITIKT